VKCMSHLCDSNKNKKVLKIFSKIPQMKFYENPSGGSRRVSCRCTDRLVVIRHVETKRLELKRLVGEVNVNT
jgi:hypothetical protein